VLFLQEQYVGGDRDQKRIARSHLFSIGRFTRIARSIRAKPFIVMDMNWWKRQLLFRRTLFHAMAGFRYLCEIPRWRWLNWQAQNRAG
jgi:hypothetical protein